MAPLRVAVVEDRAPGLESFAFGLGRDDPISVVGRITDLEPNTSRNHNASILSKLGARSQPEAVVMAARTGLIGVGWSR